MLLVKVQGIIFFGVFDNEVFTHHFIVVSYLIWYDLFKWPAGQVSHIV